MTSEDSPGRDRSAPTTIDGIVEAVSTELAEEDLIELAAQDNFNSADHYFGFGMRIRNRFMWYNACQVREFGFYHPDEISSKILTEVWRRPG